MTEKISFLNNLSGKLSKDGLNVLLSLNSDFEYSANVVKSETGIKLKRSSTGVDLDQFECIVSGTLEQLNLFNALLLKIQTTTVNDKQNKNLDIIEENNNNNNNRINSSRQAQQLNKPTVSSSNFIIKPFDINNITDNTIINIDSNHNMQTCQPTISPPQSKNIHKCQQCSYNTKRKEHLKRHVQNVHLNVRKYLCPKCGKRFKRNGALRDHLLTHDSNTKRLHCPICGLKFHRRHHLQHHINGIHSEKRPFLCEQCGATFKTKSTLRRHEIAIHSSVGKRLHNICDICRKTFSSKYSLSKHFYSTHTNSTISVNNNNNNDIVPTTSNDNNYEIQQDLLIDMTTDYDFL